MTSGNMKKYQEARDFFLGEGVRTIGNLSEEDSIMLVESLYDSGKAVRVEVVCFEDNKANEVLTYYSIDDLLNVVAVAAKSEADQIVMKNGTIKLLW